MRLDRIMWTTLNILMIDPDDSGALSKDVARRLMLTRQAFALNQLDFAEAASLSQPQYSQFETGKRLLSLRAALNLVQKYNITLDWLYLGDPSGLPARLADAIKLLRKKPS
jgi:transcriptional regulator with XRE-family HTH domain